MTKELAKVQSFSEIEKVAKAMAQSGYFTDAKDAAKAIVKILAGQEIGLGAFASMSGIHIIKGKPVLGANLEATLIKNDPRYDYKVVELTDTNCLITFFENGQEVGDSPFSITDAKKAGLTARDNWKNYPRNMLFARALSNGTKWYTPGVFGGTPVYTPDEFGLETDEQGDVIEGQIKDVEPTPEPEPEQSPPTTSTRPYPAEQIIKMLQSKADEFAADGWEKRSPSEVEIESGTKRLLAGFRECFLDENADTITSNRHAIMQAIYGFASTLDLKFAQIVAINRWLDSKPNESGDGFTINPNSKQEMHNILAHAMREQGQQDLL